MSNLLKMVIGISLGALGGWLAAQFLPGSHWWFVPSGIIIGGLVAITLSD